MAATVQAYQHLLHRPAQLHETVSKKLSSLVPQQPAQTLFLTNFHQQRHLRCRNHPALPGMSATMDVCRSRPAAAPTLAKTLQGGKGSGWDGWDGLAFLGWLAGLERLVDLRCLEDSSHRRSPVSAHRDRPENAIISPGLFAPQLEKFQ